MAASPPTTTLLGLTFTLTPPLITALRLTPLLSTTASLTHAYMEYLTNSAFFLAPPTTTTISQMSSKTNPTPAQTAAYRREVAKASEIVVPAWFTGFFNRGVWSVVGLNSITGLAAGVNLLGFGEGLGVVGRKWYWIGWAAAAAHMAFIPLVQGSVEAAIKMAVEREVGKGDAGEKDELEEGEVLGKAQKIVRIWVGVHKVRMLTVDIVAWISFAVGTVTVLSQ